MKKCWNCDEILTLENTDREHIIPDSCGGRLKSRWLLCKRCNSKVFGSTFDKELASQVEGIANLLIISRERGEIQNLKGKLANGQAYYVKNDGTPVMVKPVIDIKKTEKVTSYHIEARNEREFKEILNGLKKEYPQLDVEKVISNAERSNKLLNEPIHIDATIGGTNVFRAIAKIALNYYMHKGGDRKYIQSALPFVNGRSDISIVWMYYPDAEAQKIEAGTVNHIIHLTGSSDQKMLFCHIELFNLYSYLVLLDDNYEGPEVSHFYSYNIISQDVVDNDEPLLLSQKEIVDIVRLKAKFPIENVQRKINYVLNIVNTRQNQRRAHELAEKIVNNTLRKYPEDTEITESIIDEIAEEYLKEIMPYVERDVRSSSPDE